MKQVIFAASLISAMLIAQLASAQTRTPYINNRQHNQHERIQQGMHNGSLTRVEANRLRMQQAKVRHLKMMAKADGRVTPAERRMIEQQQLVASRSIYRQKHDMQRRWYH